MYKDVKPYVPPEKTHIERINDAFELQETLDNIGEGVLQLIVKKEDEYGNIYTVTIEVPIDD